jgi:hypothetical protein
MLTDLGHLTKGETNYLSYRSKVTNWKLVPNKTMEQNMSHWTSQMSNLVRARDLEIIGQNRYETINCPSRHPYQQAKILLNAIKRIGTFFRMRIRDRLRSYNVNLLSKQAPWSTQQINQLIEIITEEGNMYFLDDDKIVKLPGSRSQGKSNDQTKPNQNHQKARKSNNNKNNKPEQKWNVDYYANRPKNQEFHSRNNRNFPNHYQNQKPKSPKSKLNKWCSYCKMNNHNTHDCTTKGHNRRQKLMQMQQQYDNVPYGKPDYNHNNNNNQRSNANLNPEYDKSKSPILNPIIPVVDVSKQPDRPRR